MNELFFFRQLFAEGSEHWISAVLLACLFMLCIFKPERIRHRRMFQWACILFALSILAPSLSYLVLSWMDVDVNVINSTRRSFNSGDDSYTGLLAFISFLRPALTGISVLLALISVSPAPPPKASSQKKSSPRPHPLD